MSEDEDDETGSEINVKVTSSQTKTPPNIVGKTIQFSSFSKVLDLRAFWQIFFSSASSGTRQRTSISILRFSFFLAVSDLIVVCKSKLHFIFSDLETFNFFTLRLRSFQNLLHWSFAVSSEFIWEFVRIHKQKVISEREYLSKRSTSQVKKVRMFILKNGCVIVKRTY